MENLETISADGMLNGKKTYYSISEVCSRTGLEPHVLRYWETEFPQLRPKKNRAGNRAYREKDIELVQYIQNLLYEQQFTIPGAKRKLAQGGRPVEAEQIQLNLPAIPSEAVETSSGNKKLGEVRKELGEILALLSA
jgi:DNA-binding transcriptional MerR regulator